MAGKKKDSKGRAGKKKKKADGAAAIVGDFAANLIRDIPSGFLNSLDLPIAVTDRISEVASPDAAIRQTVKKVNSPDLVTGASDLLGVVMRLETKTKNQSSFIDSIKSLINFGDEDQEENGYVKAKVLVPEMHRMLMRPWGRSHPEYPAQKNINDLVIDFYPTFQSISNDPQFQDLAIGDVVTVSFRSKNNFTTSAMPVIVSKMAVSVAADRFADCADLNAYLAKAPSGAPMPDNQRSSGHTGDKGSARRARNKRSIAQVFMHQESGEILAKNLSSMVYSRGYSVNVADSATSAATAKKVQNGPISYLSHTLGLDILVAEADKKPMFSTGAENITISYRVPHSDPADLNFQLEQQKIKDIFAALINIIDKQAGGAPIINFILDPNWSLWDDQKTKVCVTLKSDISFRSKFSGGLSRINFFDTVPKDHDGTYIARAAATKLSPDLAAHFVEHIASAFASPTAAGMITNKRPGPPSGPDVKPLSPFRVDTTDIIKAALSQNDFETPVDAEQFLAAISVKTATSLEQIKSLDPSSLGLAAAIGITPAMVSDIVGQQLPAAEIAEQTNRIERKISSAIDVQRTGAARASGLSVGLGNLPKSGPVRSHCLLEAAADLIDQKQEKVKKSESPSGALPGYEANQEQYDFRNTFDRDSTSYLIIHNPAAPWKGVASLASHLNNKGLGVHFTVSPTGEVKQLIDMSKGCYHAPPVNKDSIAIEVANASPDGMTNPVYKYGSLRQMKAVYKLVKTICKHTSIPFRFGPAIESEGQFYNGWKAFKWAGIKPGVFGHGHFQPPEGGSKQHSDGKFEILYMALRKKGLSPQEAYGVATRTEDMYHPPGLPGRTGYLDVPALRDGITALGFTPPIDGETLPGEHDWSLSSTPPVIAVNDNADNTGADLNVDLPK